MKITDIISLAIDGKINYAEAKSKLKELKLPEDTFEEYDMLLHKLLADDSKILHEPIHFTNIIPNEMYYEILQESIQQVREEKYSPEIAQSLFDEYRIGNQLINYFLNESISIVRMNSLQENEVHAIGQAYYKAMKLAETIEEKKKISEKVPKQHIRKRKPKVQQPKINAEQTSDVEIIDNEDY